MDAASGLIVILLLVYGVWLFFYPLMVKGRLDKIVGKLDEISRKL